VEDFDGLSGILGAATSRRISMGKLLDKIGLTEREALDAIVRDGDIGGSIRRFVQDCRQHCFVPENVLSAVKLLEAKVPTAVGKLKL
jgi:2-hydroxy-3-keto-5-methylthiopentenyl-1-phosphate phosphatase